MSIAACNKSHPLISVIVPSCNQGHFLAQTIESILSQDYPHIEIIVIDGGSNDNSVDVIKRYESSIAYWVSEPDRGLSHALNKGLEKATGDLVGWQNSDDIYLPGAFSAIIQKYRSEIDVYFGDVLLIDSCGKSIRELRYCPFTINDILHCGMTMANQSALFRRELLSKVGGLDETLKTSMDGDLFLKLAEVNAKFSHIGKLLGAFRVYPGTITSNNENEELRVQEWERIRARHSVGMDRDIPWGRQYRLHKMKYSLKKTAYLLIRGQLGYVFRGLASRFRKFC